MDRTRFVNQGATPGCDDTNLERGPWQPHAMPSHRRPHMFNGCRIFVAILAAATMSLQAQSDAAAGTGGTTSPTASVTVSSTIRPALAQVAQALTGMNTRRWKAPNEVRSAADQDASSIQRDLNGTLAGLLQQADAAPSSVPAAFAVYRNVNALYDTLLRVVLTANLAAPDQEASALQSALSNLETARSALGGQVLSGARTQEGEVVRLRTVIANASVPREPVKTTVVNDGPAPEPARKKHVARKPSSSKTSSNQSTTAQKPANSGQNSNPQ